RRPGLLDSCIDILSQPVILSSVPLAGHADPWPLGSASAVWRVSGGSWCVGGDLVDEVAVFLGVGEQVAQGGVLVLAGGGLVPVEDALLPGEVGHEAADVARVGQDLADGGVVA